MNITIFLKSANHERFKETLFRFGTGMMANGITPHFSSSTKYEECDCAVFFGSWKDRNVEHHNLKRDIVDKAPNFIVLETPLIGRQRVTNFMEDEWYRIGVNGFLRDTGDFNNKNCEPDRWKLLSSRLNINIDGWKVGKETAFVLVALQLPGDASLRGKNINTWAANVVQDLRMHTDRPIIVRTPQLERPFNLSFMDKYKDITIQKGTKDNLAETLQKCWCTVTYTSGLAVDSVLEGCPTIAHNEGNFAYDISSHDIGAINHPKRDSIYKWLYDLSYCQWHVDEIEKGLPWNHLKSVINDRT